MVSTIKKPHSATKLKREASKIEEQNKPFSIVGMGGSAGAFPSFEKFFLQMPADSGLAFVVVMHLDPHYKSQLSGVIQQYTDMEVLEATDGLTILKNKVYIIPPNKDMGMLNGKLLLLSPSKPKGIRQPIDYFLQSMAEDQWNRAFAIIFSGMGSDGETGVRMIKEKLGLTMVQDPETAEYSSMPLASIGTNLVDYVLAPEEMPLKLIQYINHPVIAEETSDKVRSAIQSTNAIQKILMLLRSHTGNDFALYKKSTVTRRIDRRIAFHQLNDYSQYVQYLKENTQEIDVLFNELLIGVTKFFRDAEAFDSIKDNLLELVKQRKTTEPIRVWVTGCSTGEEAYSVAMLLVECLGTLKRTNLPRIQIYATDLDADALDHARAGVYNGNIVADVSPERMERFFVKKDQQFAVKKELREMIVFAQHSLIKDAPFIKLDLLCCRNMLIYFTAELQRKIIPLFYYAINPGGTMFMGPAETIGGFTDMFSPIDPKWKLFKRKEGNVQMSKVINFPFQNTQQPINITKLEEVERPEIQKPIAEIFNNILTDKFTPASVLVNEKGDILYSNGKSGKYLELPNGIAQMNIYKMAKEELRYAIANSIHEAFLNHSTVSIDHIKIKENDQIRLINLKAASIKEPGTAQLVLVVFEDQGLFKKSRNRNVQQVNLDDNPAVEELEKELVYTKLRLNSTIEQMESSLEALKSTNEELQSTNEELQSTNEESLTTKEEMQSLNEELMTMNSQYQSKGDELTRLNNDMKNLLDSTEIGTIFLDNNLDIVRYTPQVRNLFNLIPTDVGRPISHVVSNFEQPFNEDDISEVIDKLSNKEIDVRTKNKEWYRVRIMPYRTLDNFISGAVLTFTLITDYKEMESRLRVLKDYAAGLMNAMTDAVCQLNKDLEVTQVNDHFLKLFEIKEEHIIAKKLGDFLTERWHTDIPEQLLKTCLEELKEVTGLVPVLKNNYKFIASPFFEETNTTPLIVIKLHEEAISS